MYVKFVGKRTMFKKYYWSFFFFYAKKFYRYENHSHVFSFSYKCISTLVTYVITVLKLNKINILHNLQFTIE